mgnify:CR=1 FL=1
MDRGIFSANKAQAGTEIKLRRTVGKRVLILDTLHLVAFHKTTAIQGKS